MLSTGPGFRYTSAPLPARYSYKSVFGHGPLGRDVLSAFVAKPISTFPQPCAAAFSLALARTHTRYKSFLSIRQRNHHRFGVSHEPSATHSCIMPRNEAPDNTVMRDVPPGDETGIYYILLGGLPFGTVWQLLKDWLREAGCDVDHVEVFQKSTSGWIRLIGKDNFERALRHLQTTAYNNRLLLYLDKNRANSIKIMELIDDPPPRPRAKLPVKHAAASRGQEEQEKAYAADAVPAMGYCEMLPESFWTPNDLQSMFGTDPFGMSRWGWQYGSTYTPGYRSYDQPLNPASPNGQQSSSSAYPRPDPAAAAGARPSKPPSRTGSGTTPSDSSRKPPHAGEERCKVHLLSLKHAASPQDVEEWVRGSLGPWAAAVCGVDIPMDQQKGHIRGSGYITFLSAAAAKRAADVLNQGLFMNRVVYARLVDEGDRGKAKGRGRGSRRCVSTGHPPDDKRPAQAAQQDAGGKAEARYSGPVIAHGTNYRPK
ncbi:RNA recognition motif domain protein [Tolypocladium capitatum]|uniref:RNA recognition motif domain protein n=1 Tax=Tolypocladium capitatum TaxID=45235 RepID=A0A2K3QED0_9HYPO|nr:RNA recognition motif domain protein [Tolypocladium capitatum]